MYVHSYAGAVGQDFVLMNDTVAHIGPALRMNIYTRMDVSASIGDFNPVQAIIRQVQPETSRYKRSGSRVPQVKTTRLIRSSQRHVRL